MGMRRTSSSDTTTEITTTETTTTTSMDGGGDGGMDGGGMGGACYIYTNVTATPGLATPDVTYNRGIDMQIPLTMDDGNTINMWGFTDGGGGGMGGMGGGGTFPSAAMRV
ncbi:MAG: hypothetical protein OEW99_08940, partial [Gammaproteobacteria bacterium]|nr:hypothetical protein [Gammaproteobacteria bacterium]